MTAMEVIQNQKRGQSFCTKVIGMLNRTADIKIQRVTRAVPDTHDPNPDCVTAGSTTQGTPTQIPVDTTAPARTEIRSAPGNPKVVKRTLDESRSKCVIMNCDLSNYMKLYTIKLYLVKNVLNIFQIYWKGFRLRGVLIEWVLTGYLWFDVLIRYY